MAYRSEYDTAAEKWNYESEGGYIWADPRAYPHSREGGCDCPIFYKGHVICETVDPRIGKKLEAVPQMVDVLTQIVRAVLPARGAKDITVVALYAEKILHDMGIQPLADELLLTEGE